MASRQVRALVGLTLLLVVAGCVSGNPAVPVARGGNTQPLAPQSCAFCPEQSPPGCTLCVASNPLLSVDKDGAASATLHLAIAGGAGDAGPGAL